MPRRCPGCTSWRSRRLATLPALALVVVLAASGCGTTGDAPAALELPGTAAPVIAVFPVENLSGGPAPLDDVRAALVGGLQRAGVRVLDDATLEASFRKHRVRYTAGLELAFAHAVRAETGAQAILIPSLEIYDQALPPRVALFARLVTTDQTPAVVWVDGAAGAGDEAPGVLGIGIVDDPRILLARGVDRLTASLVRHLSGGERDLDRPGRRKFSPKLVYRAETAAPVRGYSIAVVPFFNKSGRPYAGELVALHMMRNLSRFTDLRFVEPGLVREELLRFRIIMDQGVSLADTDTILGAVNADMVLNGEVFEYQEPRGGYGAPKVDFAVLFIERKTRQVLYSSYSHNAGDDGVYFFDWGRVNTAHAMAAEMAWSVGGHLVSAATASKYQRERK